MATKKKTIEQTEVPETEVSPVVPDANPPNEGKPEPETTEKAVRLSSHIAPIDERPAFQTDFEKNRSDLLDLMESLHGRRILTGYFQGLEQSSPSASSCAVIYYGNYKVIIPVTEAVIAPEDLHGLEPDAALRFLVTKRLGAEVDFIVKGIDEMELLAVASRLEAMAQKRHQYFFGKKRALLEVGKCAEARIVSVIKSGVFVDVFGVECFVPTSELSYQHMRDAQTMFAAGQRVPVRILENDCSDPDKIKLVVSVKQVSENPYQKAQQLYRVGDIYFGTVSMVTTNGIYVNLSEGIDCFCPHSDRGRPHNGSRVTVRILSVRPEICKIKGVILHVMG